MEKFDYIENPHRRYNPLTGEWVLVSPHRSKRPWQGQVEKVVEDVRPSHDPNCYLCPRNERIGGESNPDYKDVYSFQNDFSALLQDTPKGEYADGELFKAESESGVCKVICFSPDHSLTVPEMEVENIRKVVDLWCKEYKELGDREDIGYVQIFENKGPIMGCSNPHPHGQIWASGLVPLETSKESKTQKAYFEKHGKTMLFDYLNSELEKKERILVENDSFVALIPFWAVWPFETMIISKRAVSNLLELTDEERTGLADIYKKLTIMYDNLFEVSFAYSAGVHQAPTDGEKHPEWHLHMHFFPPLLRSASVKKFMVGYEMLGTPQRDITAEGAAKRLRDLPLKHYKQKKIMKGKILVTGGTGYIGSHTTVELINKGYEVVIIDNLSNSEVRVVDSIEKITGTRPKFYEMDLLDQVKLDAFFAANKDLKGIIHFAAAKAVGESVNIPLHYYRNNLVTMLNLLEGMKKYEIENFVFSSSCTVYGQPDELPVTENAPIKPAESPYGYTKQVNESILRDTIASGAKIKGIALRYFNPIGAHESGLIGELPIGVPANLMPFVTQTAYGLRDQLSVFGDDYDTPDGSCIRDYIHVVDLAKAHIIAIERMIDGKNASSYEMFNIGTGNGFSVFEVIKSFEKTSGKKLNYVVAPRRAGDIVKIWADTTIGNTVLGWKAEKTLDEMTKSAWDWENNYRASIKK